MRYLNLQRLFKTLKLELLVLPVLLLAIFNIYLAQQLVQSTAPKEGTRADGNNYYVSPAGSGSACSQQSPCSLSYALGFSSPASGGDTIWLNEGTYGTGTTKFISYLRGTSNTSPVKVRVQQNVRATINGGIIAYGQYTWFWGLEIKNSNLDRTADESIRPTGFRINGTGIRAINLIIHDTGHPGIAMQSEAGPGSEIYGGLIWGVGTYDTDRNGTRRGSAIYAQGHTSNSTRYIRDVISFRNLSTGMKFYGEQAYMNNGHFEGNVAFDNSDRQMFASGRDHPVSGLKLINNYTYRASADTNEPVRVGYAESDQVDATIRGNYFVGGTHTEGGFWIKRWRNVEFTNNTVVGVNAAATYIAPASKGTYNWNGNQYYSSNSTPFKIGTSAYSFSNWKSRTGFDSSSTYTASRKTGLEIFVRKNMYESNRANVIIYNWDKLDTVEIPASKLSSVGLRSGDRFELRNAQNYYNDIITGTFDGVSIRVPMLASQRPMVSIADLNFTPRATFPEFGVFVIYNLSGSVAATPTAAVQLTPTLAISPTTAPAAVPGASTTTLYATADAHVRSGAVSASDADTNYGTALELVIDNTPDPIEKAYLKFDLSSLVGKKVSSALLRVYLTNGSTETQAVRGVTGNWAENTITYNYRPSMGAPIATLNGGASNSWAQVDITSYVAGKEGQVLLLGLDTAGTDGVHFSSRESSNDPQLVIQFAEPTLTPTPIPTATPVATAVPVQMIFVPAEDTYVSNASAGTNYGNATILSVDGTPIILTYMKFDLASLNGKNIRSAILRLRLTSTATSVMSFKSVASNSWSETTMTYNNHPALGDTLVTFNGGASGTWKEVDITSQIRAAAGQTVTFGINSSGADNQNFYSSENSSGKPSIIVEVY